MGEFTSYIIPFGGGSEKTEKLTFVKLEMNASGHYAAQRLFLFAFALCFNCTKGLFQFSEQLKKKEAETI